MKTIEVVRVVQILSECLGIEGAYIELKYNKERTTVRFTANDPNSMYKLPLPEENYSIHTAINGGEHGVYDNTGTYISYFRNDVFSNLTAYSDRMNLANFLDHNLCLTFMRSAQAKYGFAVDWRAKASFWAYTTGFQDFASLNGDLLGETPAGRWGVALRRDPDTLLDGNFRDIYPINFLSDMHLSHPIPEGESRDLICGRTPEPGALTEISPNWYRWTVPLENIQNVRREFLLAGLLDARFVWPGVFDNSPQ